MSDYSWRDAAFFVPLVASIVLYWRAQSIEATLNELEPERGLRDPNDFNRYFRHYTTLSQPNYYGLKHEKLRARGFRCWRGAQALWVVQILIWFFGLHG